MATRRKTKCISATNAISGGWCSTHSTQVSKAAPRTAANSLHFALSNPQKPSCGGLAVSQSKWSTNQYTMFRAVGAATPVE
jgi:hypothetical protein